MDIPVGKLGTSRFAGRDGWVITAIALAQFCLTLFLSLKLNVSLDEAWSLRTSSGGIGYAASQAITFETQAPLYFVLLAIWRGLSGAVWWARLFSVTCASLTVFLTASLSRRYVKELSPVFITLAVATHPLLIYAATEVRLYALLALICCLLMLLFYDGYLAAQPSRRAEYLYLLVSLVGLYTQYYVGFLLVANACGLLLSGRWKSLRRYLFGMGGIAVVFAPLMKIALEQRASLAREVGQTYSLAASARVIVWRIQEFLFPMWKVEWGRWQRWLLILLAAAIIFYLVRNRFRLVTQDKVVVWAVTASLVCCFTLLVKLTHFDMVLPRHAIPLFFATLVSTFAIMAATGRRGVVFAFTAIMLVLNLMYVYWQYLPMAKNGDYARVAEYLKSSERDGQPILIYHGMSEVALGQYYSGRNAIVPIPISNSYERYDLQSFILKSEGQLDEVFLRRAGNPPQLWLVEDLFCEEFGIDFNCRLLEEYVEKNYAVEAMREFHRARVRLLRRRQ